MCHTAVFTPASLQCSKKLANLLIKNKPAQDRGILMAFQALKLWGVAMVATLGIGLAGCTTDQINMATQAIGMVTAPNNGAVGTAPVQTNVGGLEYNTDRYGSDYNSFELRQANPVACQAACQADGARCKAFTYVKPGVQATGAMCHLKNTIPSPSACDFCVSGVNRMR